MKEYDVVLETTRSTITVRVHVANDSSEKEIAVIAREVAKEEIDNSEAIEWREV